MKNTIRFAAIMLLALWGSMIAAQAQPMTEEQVNAKAERLWEFKEFTKSLPVGAQVSIWREHYDEQMEEGNWSKLQRAAAKRFEMAALNTEFFSLESSVKAAKIEALQRSLRLHFSGIQITQLFEALCPHHLIKYRRAVGAVDKPVPQFFSEKGFMATKFDSSVFARVRQDGGCLIDAKPAFLRASYTPPSAVDPVKQCRNCDCVPGNGYCAVYWGPDWYCKWPWEISGGWTCCSNLDCGIFWAVSCTGQCRYVPGGEA
jgi:hypothetical protein